MGGTSSLYPPPESSPARGEEVEKAVTLSLDGKFPEPWTPQPEEVEKETSPALPIFMLTPISQ
jgi:hypothetical protein